MAIIKHRSSKNADYSKPVNYYLYQHKEESRYGHYKPVLDDNGRMLLRKKCATFAINGLGKKVPHEAWISECHYANYSYGKNRSYNEIKTHEFIISFSAEDRAKLTYSKLEEIACDYVNLYCKGHPALISIHRDTDNDHIHISINSVRTYAREPMPWMLTSEATGKTLSSEINAGGKFQDSNRLERDRNHWILNVCRSNGLKLEDNNKMADKRKELRRQERREYLIHACKECAREAVSAEDLRGLLLHRYGVAIRVRGKTISVKHPAAQKAVRIKQLGITPEDLVWNFVGADTRKMELLYALGDMLEVPRSLTRDTYEQYRKLQLDYEQMMIYWAEYQKSIELFWKWYQEASDRAWKEYCKKLQILKRWFRSKKTPKPSPQMDKSEIFCMFLCCPMLGLIFLLLDDDSNRYMIEWEQQDWEYYRELEKIYEEYEGKKKELSEYAVRSKDKTLSLEERIKLLVRLQSWCKKRLKMKEKEWEKETR